MKDIITDLDKWIDSGEEKIAIATVLKTYGSAPRGVGGKLAIGGEGRITGSISGGCVESSIIEEGLKTTYDSPPRVLHFETSDETAWDVGLPCGGTIDVLLEPLNREHLDFLRERVRTNERAYTVTVIGAPDNRTGNKMSFDGTGRFVGSIGPDPEADRHLTETAYACEHSMRVETRDGLDLFVEVFPPAPTLVLVGGVHIAIALARIAKVLGFITVVVDPRKTFGSSERFPEVDRLLGKWPEEAFDELVLTPETAVVVLTHDPKLDDPALTCALRSPAFYIGALGSNRTQARRKQRLLEMGFSEAELSRIHGPVGLEIAASSPEEIALSIATEIIALSHHANSVLRTSDFAIETGT